MRVYLLLMSQLISPNRGIINLLLLAKSIIMILFQWLKQRTILFFEDPSISASDNWRLMINLLWVLVLLCIYWRSKHRALFWVSVIPSLGWRIFFLLVLNVLFLESGSFSVFNLSAESGWIWTRLKKFILGSYLVH